MTYNFFCTFCGEQFESCRWDAKTCSHDCRSRFNRKQELASNEKKEVFCNICGEKNNASTCGAECSGVLEEIKKYGMTTEISEKISDIISGKRSILKKLLSKKSQEKDEEDEED